MRALKYAGFAIGGLVALLVLALVAVWLFVDPNDYKDRISAAVKQSTGRSLSLPGELKLSVFPWIKLQTGEAALGNPAGFGDEPFLTLKRASLSVKLMPLLKKQLEVGRIEIDGLDLKLRQNAAGKGNWEEWSAAHGDSRATGGVVRQCQHARSRRRCHLQTAASASRTWWPIDVNVDIGRVATGVAVPVDVRMQLTTAPGAKPLPLAAKFRLTLDLEQQRYQLADVALSGSVQPEGAPERARLEARPCLQRIWICRHRPWRNPRSPPRWAQRNCLAALPAASWSMRRH